jgi:hypothetical protein
VKQTLFLHIGRPKTGSTALQNFLHQNRNLLLEHDICYARAGLYQKASHKLSLSLLPNLPDHSAADGITADKLFTALIEEARASGAQRIVVSSEHFWLLDPALIPTQLRDEFDVKIVAYLRRQDEVLTSSFVQEVKGGTLSLSAAMGEFVKNPTRLELLDYHQVLLKWADVFGTGNILARVYEDLDAENGIEKDFITLLGSVAPAKLKFAAQRKNVSPSLVVLKLLADYHELALDSVSRRRLAETFNEVESLLSPGQAATADSLLNYQQRSDIIASFEQSNLQLARCFFADKSTSPFPPLKQSAAEPDQEQDKLEYSHRLLSGAVAYQQRQLVLAQNRIKRLEDASAKRQLAPRGLWRRLRDWLG